mmetsp:Transcript_608/g.1319  ORF Transcript_608/g.1319 Transcript_608/m.1319 type:complete len:201 (+) Transcript_608:577-1179(+)
MGVLRGKGRPVSYEADDALYPGWKDRGRGNSRPEPEGADGSSGSRTDFHQGRPDDERPPGRPADRNPRRAHEAPGQRGALRHEGRRRTNRKGARRPARKILHVDLGGTRGGREPGAGLSGDTERREGYQGRREGTAAERPGDGLERLIRPAARGRGLPGPRGTVRPAAKNKLRCPAERVVDWVLHRTGLQQRSSQPAKTS